MVKEPTKKPEKSEPEIVDPVKALTQPGGVTRRKFNRGSTRRINRALESVQKELLAFCTEIDMQAYLTDDEGNRVGSLPWIEAMRNLATRDLPQMVAEITTPVVALPTVAPGAD